MTWKIIKESASWRRKLGEKANGICRSHTGEYYGRDIPVAVGADPLKIKIMLIIEEILKKEFKELIGERIKKVCIWCVRTNIFWVSREIHRSF